MTKSIIFPVNNKGGVGKTSILTDLSSTLAQRHSVGIIDTDHQASLAGTLCDEDLSCRELPYYEELRVRDIILMKSTNFNFNNGLARMGLDVNETKAKLGVFPLGLLYDSPEKKDKLETIINQEMVDVSFLAIDLPPISHPSLVLDYTIMPIVEMLQGDVRLFPLLVSTPEHNVIDMGLRQYQIIAKYFEEKGIPKEKIFPISVLNKVLLMERKEKEETVLEPYIGRDISKKLSALGILYTPHFDTHIARINHFNKKFEFDGKRFRSVAFPFLEEIRDGKFSLLWGEEPGLHHYPHLVDLVVANNFDVPLYDKPIETMYLFALGELVNYIVAKSGDRPSKNYTKRMVVFEPSKITSKVVAQLRDVLKTYYTQNKKIETELVTVNQYHTSSSTKYFELPKSVSLEQLATVILKTQKTLTPSCSTTYDEVLKVLEEKDVMTNKGYSIEDERGEFVVKVCYHHYNQNKLGVGFRDPSWQESSEEKFNATRYLQNVEFFLEHLDRAFERSS